MKHTRAFTLIELLTVIAIIALLAAVVIAVVGPFQRNALMVQGVQNIKQLGAGMMNYASSHDGQLPSAGSPQPSFGGGGAGAEADAWYNVVPELAGARGVRGITTSSDFYKKTNPLFVPAARYPQNPSGPLFAIAMNDRLRAAPDGGTLDDSAVRLPNFLAAARTIILLETGVPDEEPLPGQARYSGSSMGNPRTLAARYKRPPSPAPNAQVLRDALTNLLFADGHAETLAVKDVINSTGGAYYPQLAEQGSEGKVCWTLDPETRP